MAFQSYISTTSSEMSNLSSAELESFYSEALSILGEIRDKKLLKKLPDNVSNRISGFLQKYEREESAFEYDTRRDGDNVPSCSYNSSDLESTSFWKGNVEVKGLTEGQKSVKFYCIAHGSRLSLFAGSKKKPLKAQIVLTAATQIDAVPDGKKIGNVYSIAESSYSVVTLKFSSVEEGKKWFEGYRATVPSTHDSEIEEEEDEDDGLLYVAFDELQSDSHHSSSGGGGVSKSVSFVSSVSRSDSRASIPECSAASFPECSAASFPDDSRGSSDKVDTPPINSGIKEEDKRAVEEEEIPASWGEFEYDQVYQTEWCFNLSKTVLPEKDLLSLQRGQLVLVKERVNADWWRGLDCNGQEGFIASCYLSLAFEL